jgi:hypothetical protein
MAHATHPSGPSESRHVKRKSGRIVIPRLVSSGLVLSRLAQLSSIQGRACKLDRPADPDGTGTHKSGAVCPSTHHRYRYDRNFDLTSIYRDRSCGRVGRHSCLFSRCE